MSQPFFVAEQFSGIAGKYVKLEDTIRGFQEIIDGKHDDLPEQAFYMVGTIEEAVEKANSISKKDDVVLFSPASASFDMFKNFEERGEMFKQIVNKL